MKRWTEAPMSDAQAAEYLNWAYPEEYAFYNTPAGAFEEAFREYSEAKENWFAVLNGSGEMEGIFTYEWQDADTVEIGLGLRPDLTGRGLGFEFVRQCVDFGRMHYGRPDAVVELRVLHTNERAIKVYRRAGFSEIGMENAVSFGVPVRFLRMRLAAMDLREFGCERLEEVKEIYREAGWRAYLTDDEKLKRAFQNSLYLLGAFDGDRLVGFVRCVGDGEHIVLIQDVIVRASHRRRGIGRRLIQQTLDRFSQVRMISLYTDAEDEADNCFYRSLGFRLVESGGMASYMR